MSLGLCVPSVCTANDFDAFKPFFVEAINSMLPEFLAGIKGFDTELQLSVTDLDFEDSVALNKEVTGFSLGAFLAILMFLCFAFGVVLSSFLYWKMQVKEE